MKKKFHFLFTLPVSILLGCLLIFLALPQLVDHFLFPRLIKDLPFTEKQVSLSRLSPWQIRATLTLADADRETLSVPRIELYYSPGSLLQRKISGILVDSLSLQIDLRKGQPLIRGLSARNAPTRQNSKSSPFLLPLAVDTIIAKNCLITLNRDLGKPLTLSVNGHFSLDFLEQPEKEKLLSNLSGSIAIQGDLSLNGDVELRLKKDRYGVQLTIKAPDISQSLQLLPEPLGLTMHGGLDLTAEAIFDPGANLVSTYELAAELPGLMFKKDSLTVTGRSPEKPVKLKLSGEVSKAAYTVSNLFLATPEKLAIDLEGLLKISEKSFKGTGKFFFERTKSAAKLAYEGSSWQSTSKVAYTLESEAFTFGDTLSFSPFSASGNIEMNGGLTRADLNGVIPQIDLRKNQISLVNLSFKLPFQSPPATTKAPKGTVQVDKILYKKINSGRLQASLSTFQDGAQFSTLFTTPFISGLQLSCDGSAMLPAEISAHCFFPETQLDSSTFPAFIPLPQGLSFRGKIAADGNLKMHNMVPEGQLSVKLSKGKLIHGENILSDINFDVLFPHLPLLISKPSQLCTISSLEFGKIKLSDARIRFRVEDQQAVFLEKIRATWCGGKVETGSFGLAGDMQELETTLYCDRLGFTELLSQFGIDKAEGQGSLNGRLPVHMSKTGLIFDDGFLFSTPGNSGIIRFNDTGQLRQGIPNIEQSAYLDYSMKALENFSYNWTKLSFNSVDDDLLISMQLDGKPAKPLPFGYKQGQIIPTNQGPGLQHPIRLDVNFRLPLQDLFQYGKNIQSIMEKM